MEFWKILITVLLAIIGWIAAHYFTSRRDVQNKKREIRVKFLIEVYQKLENAIQRPAKKVGNDLEYVVATIQLFGSNEQILLAKNIANDIANNGSADLEPLLKSLRTDLRKDLKLSKTDDGIQFLRMENT